MDTLNENNEDFVYAGSYRSHPDEEMQYALLKKAHTLVFSVD